MGEAGTGCQEGELLSAVRRPQRLSCQEHGGQGDTHLSERRHQLDTQKRTENDGDDLSQQERGRQMDTDPRATQQANREEKSDMHPVAEEVLYAIDSRPSRFTKEIGEAAPTR